MSDARVKPEVVEALLRKVQQGEDFPGFSEHLGKLLEAISEDTKSMRQVTDVILRDFGLTSSVLKTANSAKYNRAGRRFETVTHAASMLGLDAIRDTATGMMMFQHFWKGSAGTKNLLLLSLLTASHSALTGNRVSYPNTEEAYLCGMFRNLGEVLVSAHLPRKYGAILKRSETFEANETSQAMRVLECSFEELGRAASRAWNLPDRVRLCMQNEAPNHRGATGDLDTLRTLVSFSHGLTDAIHRRNPNASAARLNQLLNHQGKLLDLEFDAMREIAEQAVKDTKSTFDLLHIPLDDLRLSKHTETAMEAVHEMSRGGHVDTSGAPLPPGADLMERLTEEAELAFCTGEARDLNAILERTMQAIVHGAPFDRVLFGLVSSDRRSVRGRVGIGKQVDDLIDSFDFPLSVRSGPVAVALMGKQDVFVHDSRYAHTLFGRVIPSTNFGMMPIIVNGTALGVLYFDRHPQAPVPEPEVIHQIDRLRSLLIETIELSRTPQPA